MNKTIFESVKKVLTSPKTLEKGELQISLREAFSLWTLLANRYVAIDHLNFIKNFIHDKEYKLIIMSNLERIIKENESIEKHLEEYCITPPRPNTRDVSMNAIGAFDMRDRITSHVFYRYLRAETLELSHALRGAIFNDNIRQFLKNIYQTNLKVYDTYVKFLKTKEWIALPPPYQYLKPDVKEDVAINEIFCLWEFLFTRYINIRTTQIAVSYANDVDFKAIVEMGLRTLIDQASDLEKKLLYYGVTLPEHFTKVTISPQVTEGIEDHYLYSAIFNGMNSITALKAVNILDIITNDRLRNYFIKITLQELSYIDKLIKYGKLKGWLPVPPKFKMSSV